MLKTRVKLKRPTLKRKLDNNNPGKLNRKKLIAYLVSECRTSSIHGLSYIVNTQTHWLERVFWTVSFGLCTGLTFILMTTQYYRFLEAPIVMSVEMDYFNWNISFPAITLCPIYKTDKTFLATYTAKIRNTTGANLDYYLKAISFSRLETMESLQLPDTDVSPFIKPEEFSMIAYNLFKRFDTSIISTGIEVPVVIEHAMTEMGMCHIINSNTAVFDNPLRWKDTKVVDAKHNILLSVHDHVFFTQIHNYTDIYKVYVTSPDEVVLGTTSSFYSGQEGSLSFGVQIWSTRVSEHIRLIPLHLRKCRFKDEPTSKRYPIYSYNRCLIECRIRMLHKLCGCIPHFYKPIDEERICHLVELKECMLVYKKEIMTLTTSTDTLTSSFEKFGNIDHLPRNAQDCNCYSNCEIDMYQREHEIFIPETGINKLRISVSTFPKVRIVREIIFTFSDFLLRCGGVVNLCIGSSIMSIVELLFTVLRILVYTVIQAIKGLSVYALKAFL